MQTTDLKFLCVLKIFTTKQLYLPFPYTVPCFTTQIMSLIGLQQGLRPYLQYPAERGCHTNVGEGAVFPFLIKCMMRRNKIVSEVKYDPFKILRQERK